MKKLTNKQFNDIVLREEANYCEKEIVGLVNEINHARASMDYLSDKDVKKRMIETFGEVKYLESARTQNERLKIKQEELKALRKTCIK